MPAAVERLLAVPPLVIDALVAGILLRSLLPGRMPLISRLAALARGGELPPVVARYSRRVTQFWALVFLAFAVVLALVAVGAPPRAVWPAIALAQGPACFAFVVLEYGLRRRVLRTLPHSGLLDFLRFLRRVDYPALLRS